MIFSVKAISCVVNLNNAGVETRNSRIKDQGPRIKDQGSRIRDKGSRIRDQGSGIKDQGSRIRDQGSGIGDQGSRIKDVNYVDYEYVHNGVALIRHLRELLEAAPDGGGGQLLLVDARLARQHRDDRVGVEAERRLRDQRELTFERGPLLAARNSWADVKKILKIGYFNTKYC
jgi:hypothetical protein